MAFSQREVAANVAARKVRNTELAKQDVDTKAKRDARKAELRAHLDRVELYHENTSHLPAQHKRSRAPEIDLRAGDESILAELNSELLAEIAGPVDPAQVEAENEQADIVRAQAAATQFTESEPLYYKCQQNFQIMASYIIEHTLPADSVDSYFEAFSKTRAQLIPRPPAQVKP